MVTVISPEYAALNKQLHEAHEEYGAAADRDAPGVVKFARKYGAKSLLDFGCGKGVLKPALSRLAPELEVYEFDPAVPGKDTLPAMPVDVIAAMDVMEHIEPEYLDAVLQSMVGLAPKIVIMKICLVPAQKTLPDVRNAHILLKPSSWWAEYLARYFSPRNAQELKDRTGAPTHFMYIAQPL